MWFKYVLIGMTALDILGHINRIGKTETYGKQQALASVFLNGAIIAGILYYWR